MTLKELAKMLKRETLKIETAAKIRAILDAASKEYEKISGDGAWDTDSAQEKILNLVTCAASEEEIPEDE